MTKRPNGRFIFLAEARDCNSHHWGDGPLSPAARTPRNCVAWSGVLIQPSQHKNKMPIRAFIFLADGEGFEPPVELPPQRFSRPPHSTALPTIRNCFPSVFQPVVLVLHMMLSCLHSTSLTLVVKTRSHRQRSANHPKLFSVGLSTYGFGAAHDVIMFALHFADARSQDTLASTTFCQPSETVSRRSFNLWFVYFDGAYCTLFFAYCKYKNA